MTYSGIGWNVIVMGIFAAETLIQQSLEAALTILSIETGQVIVSHLVHNDPYNQLGAVQFIFGLGSRRAPHDPNQYEEYQFFHILFLCQIYGIA